MLNLISSIWTGERAPPEIRPGGFASSDEEKLYDLVCASYRTRKEIEAYNVYLLSNADVGNKIGSIIIYEQANLAKIEEDIVQLLIKMRK